MGTYINWGANEYLYAHLFGQHSFCGCYIFYCVLGYKFKFSWSSVWALAFDYRWPFDSIGSKVTLPLSPHMLAAVYDFLRECPPFKAWKLPHSDEIAFEVVRDPTLHGYYQRTKQQHRIGVSSAAVGQTNSLIEVLAHEMIHLRQAIAKTETHGAQHNAEFRRIGQLVCRLHGWDSKMFFF